MATPIELVGLPISEERARELVLSIAVDMEGMFLRPESRDALVELLLGIAPALMSPDDAESAADFLADQQTRHFALCGAIETLFTFTPEFAEAVERYARKFGREGGQAQ